ncbi:MAG TPA: universal stress protein [Anaerolineales bacterium]|nr:universal stress protein [Anaerolineales bacterium]
MAHVSHKLKNSFEGALAGGGDPATSPLYVFGPFLHLIVVAGVANITFGASIWLVIITIAVVSAMYRLVMRWVTDGSGGSGLSEEEFGSWAVKVNAAITFIEYTLTFLVSMAAMVTFIADRIPVLNEKILWIQYRTIIAIVLSVLTGWLVNRGPKMAARTFGPATAGVLALLWAMVFATIFRYGVELPDFNLQAFSGEYFHFTIGGYVRILAVMTGIEVFANLVAAYDGTPEERSRKSFVSLLMIMGTTGVTMLVVGPAIFKLADPNMTEVSVFTQTMDVLLPQPLPLFGTLVGVAVLMSASAASAQGLQNLALGLKERRYIPPMLGKVNEFQVADKPVWIEVGIVAICFLLFGTHEDTYLAIYAAGVFILLSMTGWAVTKRLITQIRNDFSFGKVGLIVGTVIASLLTTAATVIIFEERFLEGAWTYLIFIPMLYVFFSFVRKRLGAPSEQMEYLGRLDAAHLAGFGFGQMPVTKEASNGNMVEEMELQWQPEPIEKSVWRDKRIEIKKIAVLLDGSFYAAQALPYAEAICHANGAHLVLLSSVKNETQAQMDIFEETVEARSIYLQSVSERLAESGLSVTAEVREGYLADTTKELVDEQDIDLVITSTVGKSGNPHWLSGGISSKLMRRITKPVLLVQINEDQDVIHPKMERILVSLDGSILAENTLPYARALAIAFSSEIVLLAVPQVPEVQSYRAPDQAVEQIRSQMVTTMENFLSAVGRSLREDGLQVRTMTFGSLPVRTIVSVGEEEDADLIMLTSRGRGGIDRLFMGSVAERVVAESNRAVLMVPVYDELDMEAEKEEMEEAIEAAS